jgi:hypothetical protein
MTMFVFPSGTDSSLNLVQTDTLIATSSLLDPTECLAVQGCATVDPELAAKWRCLVHGLIGLARIPSWLEAELGQR